MDVYTAEWEISWVRVAIYYRKPALVVWVCNRFSIASCCVRTRPREAVIASNLRLPGKEIERGIERNELSLGTCTGPAGASQLAFERHFETPNRCMLSAENHYQRGKCILSTAGNPEDTPQLLAVTRFLGAPELILTDGILAPLSCHCVPNTVSPSAFLLVGYRIRPGTAFRVLSHSEHLRSPGLLRYPTCACMLFRI
jgi:hypothetical protein